MNDKEILSIYQERNAVWFFDYNGDPKAPHAELTSGKCSDGYVNSAPVLEDPRNTQLLARKLITILQKRNAVLPVDWIVGSAYAAITFSHEIARQLNAKHGFVEKDPVNPKKMIWKRFTIPAGATVLQCEELITTLGTTLEVRRAVEEGNPHPIRFLPDVATAIYRPEKLDVSTGNIDVISLVAQEVKTWKPGPENCPLCAQGSKPLRPKQHWSKLTGKS